MSHLTPFGYIDFTGDGLSQLSTQVNGINNDLVIHVADTSTHGVTGNVLGTTDNQIITNKTINSANNTLQINGTNVNSLINQDIRTSSSPSFNNITLSNGSPTITTATGTLSLPTTTGTVALTSDIPSSSSFVTLSGNQTITGTKTFSSAPIISTITNIGTLTLPTTTTTLIGIDTSDTLTNKQINSSNNTLLITSSPLSSINVNSLINQDIRTTSNLLLIILV